MNELLNRFIYESEALINEYDNSSFVKLSADAVNGSAVSFAYNVNFTFYLETMTQLKKELINLNELLKDVSFTKSDYDKITGQMISEIMVTDIKSINPDYLLDYCKSLERLTNKVFSNEISVGAFKSHVLNVKDNVKHQVLRTQNKDLYSMKSSAVIKEITDQNRKVPLTPEYMSNIIIPTLDAIKSGNKSKIALLDNTIKIIQTVNMRMQSIIDVTNMKRSEIEIAKLNKIIYTIIRSLLEITSFTTAFTAKYVSVDIFNSYICNTVYAMLSENPDIVTESVESLNLGNEFIPVTNAVTSSIIDDTFESVSVSFLEGNADVFKPMADSILDYLNGLYSGKFVFADHYNVIAYDELQNIYAIISEGLDTIADAIDQYSVDQLILDNILEDAGFTQDLATKFKDSLNRASDLTVYTSVMNSVIKGTDISDTIERGIVEISDYYDNMKKLAKTIELCHKKLIGLKEEFSKGGGIYQGTASLKELLDSLDSLIDQFSELTVKVASVTMHRLNNLGTILKQIILSSKHDNYESIRSGMMVEHVVFDMDPWKHISAVSSSIYNESTRMMLEEFNLRKMEHLTGYSMYYEEEEAPPEPQAGDITPVDDNTQSSGTEEAPPDQGEQSDSTNQSSGTEEAPPDSTGDAIQTDENNQSSGTEEAPPDNKISSQMDSWFNEVCAKIKALSNSSISDENSKYILENKKTLLEKNYTGKSSAIEIIEYEKLMPYKRLNADSKIIANKTGINSLSVEKLSKLKDETEIRNHIFGQTPPPKVWDSDNVSDALTQFYKCGTYNENRVTLKGSDLKSEVETAINYCSNFYRSILPQIKGNIEEMKNNVSALLSKITTESVDIYSKNLKMIFEGNDPESDIDVSDISSKCDIVQKLIQLYVNALLTAAFCRYNDYMELIRSIPLTDGQTVQTTPEPVDDIQQPQGDASTTNDTNQETQVSNDVTDTSEPENTETQTPENEPTSQGDQTQSDTTGNSPEPQSGDVVPAPDNTSNNTTDNSETPQDTTQNNQQSSGDSSQSSSSDPNSSTYVGDVPDDNDINKI